MITTLAVTVLIESMVVIGYARWCKKPLFPLLLTELTANLLTQSLLWIALHTFPFHYLLTLLTMEVLIVGIELSMLHLVPRNQLSWKEAFFLSLAMNLASFLAGWFLPV